MENDIVDNEIVIPRKYLVLSGGGIKGISHIGALKRLEEKNLLILNKLEGIAGTSVGALLGMLIVLGYTIDEIWDFVYNLDMSNLLKPDFLIFFTKYGIDTGQIIYDLIEDILVKKTGTKHINFHDLYELTKIDFTVVGACLTTKDVVYYSHTHTPYFKVSTAIRISISVPGLFIPVTIGKNVYLDGAMINNYPMDIYQDKLSDTIGILICNDCNTDFKYPEQYIMAIINFLVHNYYKKTVPQYDGNTVYITKSQSKLPLFDFNIDNETKIALFETGINAVDEFIKNK